MSLGVGLLIFAIEQSSCRGRRPILELNLLFERVIYNHRRVLPIVSRSVIIIDASQKVLWVDSVIYVVTKILVAINVVISLEEWFLICHSFRIHNKIILLLVIVICVIEWINEIVIILVIVYVL